MKQNHMVLFGTKEYKSLIPLNSEGIDYFIEILDEN
jgi:hypothetical protein